MHARFFLLALPIMLAGCDLLGIETASQMEAKKEAEGRAIGSACRHAVRSIEDCYGQNPKANKAAVFSGWREMDEYMRENNVTGMPFGDKKLPMITEGGDEAPAAAAATTSPTRPGAAPNNAPNNPPGTAAVAAGTRPPVVLPGTTPPRLVTGPGGSAAANAPRTATTTPAPASAPAPAAPSRPGTAAPARSS